MRATSASRPVQRAGPANRRCPPRRAGPSGGSRPAPRTIRRTPGAAAGSVVAAEDARGRPRPRRRGSAARDGARRPRPRPTSRACGGAASRSPRQSRPGVVGQACSPAGPRPGGPASRHAPRFAAAAARSRSASPSPARSARASSAASRTRGSGSSARRREDRGERGDGHPPERPGDPRRTRGDDDPRVGRAPSRVGRQAAEQLGHDLDGADPPGCLDASRRRPPPGTARGPSLRASGTHRARDQASSGCVSIEDASRGRRLRRLTIAG